MYVTDAHNVTPSRRTEDIIRGVCRDAPLDAHTPSMLFPLRCAARREPPSSVNARTRRNSLACRARQRHRDTARKQPASLSPSTWPRMKVRPRACQRHASLRVVSRLASPRRFRAYGFARARIRSPGTDDNTRRDRRHLRARARDLERVWTSSCFGDYLDERDERIVSG